MIRFYYFCKSNSFLKVFHFECGSCSCNAGPFLCKLGPKLAIVRDFTNIFFSELLDCNTSHKLLTLTESTNILLEIIKKNTQAMWFLFWGQIPQCSISDLRYGIYGKLEGGLQNHMVKCGEVSKESEITLWRPPKLPYISPIRKSTVHPSSSISSTNLKCIEKRKYL